MNWAENAGCREADPDVWFPAQGDYELSRAPRAICNACPIKQRCLEHALAFEEYGIWGGLSWDERRALLGGKSQKRTVHGTERGYAAHRRLRETPCLACSLASTQARRDRQKGRTA